jgi:aryl-alcohol dehydrogenase-like predicted oxidoreductase
MLKNRATGEATAAYARRFTNLPGNFRPVLGCSVSSIGIGTYLGHNDDETDHAYEEALKAAMLGGINLVDTAVNYRFQRSERTIGRVLKELVAGGRLQREEIVVATKGGYLTFDGDVPSDPRVYLEDTFVRTGIIAHGELAGGSHCMAPRYLEAMLELSRANLGLDTIDIYYLHNPEEQLATADRQEFLSRVRRAFELLEAKAVEGRIGVYGTATWNGYRVDPRDGSYLSLKELVDIAAQVGGRDHHFRVIQLPYNLAMPEALTLANQVLPDGEKVTPLAAAKAMNIAVCASTSLLQGRLARGLPAVVGEAFGGLSSDAQRSVQFVRSTPGVDVALVGMRSAEHVREALETAKQPPAPFEALMKLFKRADR